jgi:arsenical pump membrane protein
VPTTHGGSGPVPFDEEGGCMIHAQPLLILVLTVVSVLAIVSNHRFAVEGRLRARFGIDRDWWIPVIAFAIAMGTSTIGWPIVETTFVEKFDIIVLIFAFGIMSEGLGASGFFRYLAYKIVALCEGNSRRLVLYMFTMTSAVTLFTTNDIVVLVVTPVIIEICFQAGIRNSKPLLLSQFIAANTLSMGLLIGSPTNIIIAEELGINFFEYLGIMFVPAVVAFGSSFLLISKMTDISETGSRFFNYLKIQPTYSMPEEVPEPYFTPQMRNWIAIFGVFVGLVALVTFVEASLYWCAIPSILIAAGYWVVSDDHEEPITGPLKRLPYGVFFFGMTFFVFAEAFVQTAFVERTLIPVIETFFAGRPVRSAIVGVLGSGVLVNVFNDLPAAALLANVLSRIEFASTVTRTILVQASLVGLNIGTYVTQIGALAGLIWFNQIRIHRSRQRERFPEMADEMSFPDRSDLVRYGVTHFLFTGVSAGMFLVFAWVLLSILLGPF